MNLSRLLRGTSLRVFLAQRPGQKSWEAGYSNLLPGLALPVCSWDRSWSLVGPGAGWNGVECFCTAGSQRAQGGVSVRCRSPHTLQLKARLSCGVPQSGLDLGRAQAAGSGQLGALWWPGWRQAIVNPNTTELFEEPCEATPA